MGAVFERRFFRRRCLREGGHATTHLPADGFLRSTATATGAGGEGELRGLLGLPAAGADDVHEGLPEVHIHPRVNDL